MRLLIGDPSALGGDGAGDGDPGNLDGAALRRLYAYPDPVPPRGFVRGNMVTSVDGSVTGPDGRSESVSSPADREVFSVLRGLCDVVLVGAGTVRSEGYRMPAAKYEFADVRAARGQASAPCLAVVTRSGDVPENLLASSRRVDGSWGVVVVVPESIDGQKLSALMAALGHEAVIVAGETDVDPDIAVDALVRLGMPRVLCEGGPSLLGRMVATGRLDELCHTTSPLLAGGEGRRMLSGPELSMERSGMRLWQLIEEDGTLLARWQLS